MTQRHPSCVPAAPPLCLRFGSPRSLTFTSVVTHLPERRRRKGLCALPTRASRLTRDWRVLWAAPPPGGRGARVQDAALGPRGLGPAPSKLVVRLEGQLRGPLSALVNKETDHITTNLPRSHGLRSGESLTQPQQRVQLFLQRPGKGRTRHPRALLLEKLLTERGHHPRAGQRKTTFLLKAWLMFLLSHAGDHVSDRYILKTDVKICPFPFVSYLCISFMNFPISFFFLSY